MYRPCILVIDREFPGTISTRKLLLETAKFNVITAYSPTEGLATLKRFPDLDAIVLDEHYDDMDCSALAGLIKDITPNIPIVATTASGATDCPHIERSLHSYNPALLIETIRDLFPAPAAAILSNEKRLASE